MIGKWLKEAIDKSGRSQREVAAHFGIDPSAVNRMIKGLRKVTVDEMLRIASFLGVDPPFGSIDTTPTVHVAVTHEVAAGVWREGGEMLLDQTLVPAVPEPRYKAMSQRAVKVTGADFARTIAPGQFAIYVPLKELRRPPLDGEIVFISRTRNDLVEFTLRRVRFDHDNVMELYAEPVGATPPPIRNDYPPSEQLEIIGVCIGIYAPLTAGL